MDNFFYLGILLVLCQVLSNLPVGHGDMGVKGQQEGKCRLFLRYSWTLKMLGRFIER